MTNDIYDGQRGDMRACIFSVGAFKGETKSYTLIPLINSGRFIYFYFLDVLSISA